MVGASDGRAELGTKTNSRSDGPEEQPDEREKSDTQKELTGRTSRSDLERKLEARSHQIHVTIRSY